jgi:CheY-like chemotaxis protein
MLAVITSFFDIFGFDTSNEMLWIEAVPDLDIAKAQVAALMQTTPCEYLPDTKVELQLSSIRILAVDDFKDWLRQVRLLLQPRPESQVIAEASDGLEAVQKAEDLKPDLILLDIGLPKLNGIEAARRIRQRSPSSKIVFLSQNNDLAVIRAALGTGALGYVRKTDARRELLLALDAVLRGEQFISSSNGHKISIKPTDGQS